MVEVVVVGEVLVVVVEVVVVAVFMKIETSKNLGTLMPTLSRMTGSRRRTWTWWHYTLFRSFELTHEAYLPIYICSPKYK